MGIGTTAGAGAGWVVMNGNVGVGTWVPEQLLDIKGNLRTTNFTMSGQLNPISGYVLTASDSAGDTTWASAGGVSGWTISGNNVYETAGGNVGIGTTNPGQALDVNGTARMGGLTLTGNGASNGYVMVGNNVGVGSWMPFNTLGVSSQWITTNTSDVFLPNSGNVWIGINITSAGAALSVMNGNVGIGTWVPGQTLDVKGNMRATNFTMSGQNPIGGYVLTASDSAGDTTWASAGGVSGWTVTGNDVYETGNGNVGIGTTLLTTAALTVMNGNVGIGTWVPSNCFKSGRNGYFDGIRRSVIYLVKYRLLLVPQIILETPYRSILQLQAMFPWLQVVVMLALVQ